MRAQKEDLRKPFLIFCRGLRSFLLLEFRKASIPIDREGFLLIDKKGLPMGSFYALIDSPHGIFLYFYIVILYLVFIWLGSKRT